VRVLVVTNMYPNPEQPAFGTFVHDQVEDLRKAGIEVDVVFINGRKSKLNYLWGVFSYWKQLLTQRYDIVHAHYALSGIISRLQFRHPLVVTYHGVEVLSGHGAPWLTFLSRNAARLFDRVIVVAQAEADILNRSNVIVIPCAIDVDVFEPIPLPEARSQLGLPMDKQLVLWAGEHWRHQKRFELVEEAMELVTKRCQEAELVLVSGQPHEVIPIYMCACDALVLTSRYEGSPMVVKEAMACNLPIVSTRVGDVPEVIDGTEGCFLAEPEAEDVADKLLWVLDWGKRTNGRANIQHLASEPITRRVIEVYNDLCPPERRFEPTTAATEPLLD
jgi:teichuronic acid biosynthesis glycosyltransferase TuaC